MTLNSFTSIADLSRLSPNAVCHYKAQTLVEDWICDIQNGKIFGQDFLLLTVLILFFLFIFWVVDKISINMVGFFERKKYVKLYKPGIRAILFTLLLLLYIALLRRYMNIALF